jgi:hypothetical protein
MTLICRSCDQHVGTLHLDTCPLRVTSAIGHAIVSVFECYNPDLTNAAHHRRSSDKEHLNG